jgi:hypothetical protein
MSLFHNSDFDKMEFNITKIPKGKGVLEYFKRLSQYPSFTEYDREDSERAIRYLLLMYDKGSPFVTYYADLRQRKESVAVYVGYDPERDEARLEELYDLDDERFVDMLLAFLKGQNWLKWSLLVSNEQTFYEYQRSVLRRVTNYKTDKDRLTAVQVKSQIMNDCDMIVERIARYYTDIFGTRDVVEKAQGGITPESMA